MAVLLVELVHVDHEDIVIETGRPVDGAGVVFLVERMGPVVGTDRGQRHAAEIMLDLQVGASLVELLDAATAGIDVVPVERRVIEALDIDEIGGQRRVAPVDVGREHRRVVDPERRVVDQRASHLLRL